MPPLFFFLLLFIGIPLVEIYLLIQVGGIIGAFPTVLMVVFTAVLGVALIRIQGFSTLQKAQMALNQGQVPATEMMEGVLLFLAAICLLMPGFFTDTIGFLLLVPPLRHWLAKQIIASSLLSGQVSGFRTQGGYFEGEYQDLTPEQQHQKNQAKIRQVRIIEGKVESKVEDKE